MEQAHIDAIVATLGAKKGEGDYFEADNGKTVSFYVSFNGSTLTINKANAFRQQGDLFFVRTAKGETYIVNRADLFAAAIEGGSATTARKAGFI